MATKLQDFFINFKWNYHKASHSKDAPDGVGVTCKRGADRLVGTGSNISSLEYLTNALQKNSPNIKVWIINDEDISNKEMELKATENLKAFLDTMFIKLQEVYFLPIT